jgi:hypothetical protein
LGGSVSAQSLIGTSSTAAPLFPNGLLLQGGTTSALLTAGTNGDLVIGRTGGFNGVDLPTTTIASLPTSGCVMGSARFVLDGRNTGEATGAGTGAIAYCNTAHVWLVNGAPAAH